MGELAAEGGQHLLGEGWGEGGVVLAVDHESVFAGAEAPLDVRHGADRGPVLAELVDRNVRTQGFPDMGGGHALADDVGEVGGDVEEAAGADSRVVNQGDVADRGADAGAENSQSGIALLLEPAKAAAGVLDGLAISLEGQADVGADEL